MRRKSAGRKKQITQQLATRTVQNQDRETTRKYSIIKKTRTTQRNKKQTHIKGSTVRESLMAFKIKSNPQI